MSTAHRGGNVGVVERQSGPNTMHVDAAPMAEQYCQNMGGVDLAGQYRSSYCVRQKSKRWYLCLFYWILDAALVNAFICDTIRLTALQHLE